MKVLVIGQGGREHAIVRALHHSASVSEVHAVPGNIGMDKECVCHNLSLSQFDAILSLVQSHSIELVVIGPEGPIAEGLSDFLRSHQVLVFAPSQQAAKLESSKIFAKEFMQKSSVPTARFIKVNSVASTMQACENFQPPYVLKADGLCAGKGVVLVKTKEELKLQAENYFEKKVLGDAGSTAILEEYMPGWELSFHILTDGKSYQPMPLTQDHKTLLDGGEGPNTGGMGVVGPLKIDTVLYQKIISDIVEKTVQGLAKENLMYRGVLYIGVMVTEKGPMVLEYNARFGDPETQVMLPLLSGDWGLVMKSIAKGQLPSVSWKPLAVTCVVAAAEGYPEKPVKGVVIEGDAYSEGPNQYFLHAGTQLNAEGKIVVSGGRVINAIGMGSNLDESIENAYDQLKKISWPGLQYRSDIGRNT